ncbi:MAG: E3 ubiquitin protein ligase [Bacteroidia bacterium]|nr:E3 ubiquitin protein ligase [Bacteroidia bacterium]
MSDSPVCPICRNKVDENSENAVKCPQCHILYHDDCIEYIGYKCAGCNTIIEKKPKDKVRDFFVVNETRKVPVEEADSAVTIGELIGAAIKRFQLPDRDEQGNAVKYRMILQRTGKLLKEDISLANVGIRKNDEIGLVSEILIGKSPTTPQSNIPPDAVTFSAPILIPKPDDLAINLVPSDTIYRLEEYRSDQIRWEAVLWVFIGAILGTIVNWVTSDPITISRVSLILVGVFAIIAVVIGFAVREYKGRAERIKREILALNRPAEKNK